MGLLEVPSPWYSYPRRIRTPKVGLASGNSAELIRLELRSVVLPTVGNCIGSVTEPTVHPTGSDLVGSVPGLLIGLSITLFVLFALLRDGEKLVRWVQWVVPIDERILDELYEGLDQLMWASIVGNVAVAAIQAVLLGVGLSLAGLPGGIFLTVVTFVLTLLPLVGAFGVWLPAAVYLLAIDRPVAGVAIVIFGLVVSLSDAYLRPALIGRSSALNTAIIVIGIFGGLVVFGAVGLFIGPVVLGGTKLVFDCFAREHDSESII